MKDDPTPGGTSPTTPVPSSLTTGQRAEASLGSSAEVLRMARECGLVEPELRYSGSGRIPGTPWHWPWPLGGRANSDIVLMMARRPR
jgi:hypothetical protein